MAEPTVDNATQAVTGASAAPATGTMDDFIASRNKPAGGQPEKAVKPESAPGKDGASPENPDDPLSRVPPGSEPEETPKAVKELINQRRKTHEAELREAYWRGIAEGKGGAPGQPGQPGEPQKPPAKPSLDQFDTYEKYEAARDKWMDDMVEFRAAQIERKVTQRTSGQGLDAAWKERFSKAAEVNPRLKEAFDEVGTAINDHMAAVIKRSPAGPDLLLYLHGHMDETARLARSDPYIAVAALGAIEARLAAPAATKTVSKAPAPIVPVGGHKGEVALDDEKVPIDEFMRRRNEAQYGKRR